MKHNDYRRLGELLQADAESTRPEPDDRLLASVCDAYREQPDRRDSHATNVCSAVDRLGRSTRMTRRRLLTAVASIALLLIGVMLIGRHIPQREGVDPNPIAENQHGTDDNQPSAVCRLIADTAATPSTVRDQVRLSIGNSRPDMSLVNSAGSAAGSLLNQLPWGLVEKRPVTETDDHESDR